MRKTSFFCVLAFTAVLIGSPFLMTGCTENEDSYDLETKMKQASKIACSTLTLPNGTVKHYLIVDGVRYAVKDFTNSCELDSEEVELPDTSIVSEETYSASGVYYFFGSSANGKASVTVIKYSNGSVEQTSNASFTTSSIIVSPPQVGIQAKISASQDCTVFSGTVTFSRAVLGKKEYYVNNIFWKKGDAKFTCR